jgi:hypothetical protein
MLQGIYKGEGNSEILVEGQKYYLFPNGEKNCYVSRFPNQHAHTGSYQLSYFDIVEEQHYPDLDREKHYTAELTYVTPGKYPGIVFKQYYIRPRKTHALFWEDPQLNQFRGCFPLNWFEEFEEFEPVAVEEVVIAEELVEEKPIIEEPPVAKESEQLSLFEF